MMDYITVKEDNKEVDSTTIYNFSADDDGYCRGEWVVDLKDGQTLSCSIPITLKVHTGIAFE